MGIGFGGLLAPEGALEAAVSAALRNHDPDLRLVPQDSDHYGRRVYKVYRYAGSDRPAEFILFWGDEHGNPFPLSTSLVDEVQRLDRNLRGTVPDPDSLNARLVAERRRDAEADFDEIVREHAKRVDGKNSQPLPRSPGLYLARSRVRARTRSRELKP